MLYFAGCSTVEAIKKLYRQLAKKFHPDLGGDTATMQEINRQYENALRGCHGQTSTDSSGREHTYYYNEQQERDIMEKISELLRILPAGVDVMLIGKWLWITGTQRSDKATQKALKKAGCRWHNKRFCWYWKPYKSRTRYAKNSSLGDLAAAYGSKIFRDDGKPEMAAA